jgi:thiol-disulfide isomerase/thioredoxin
MTRSDRGFLGVFMTRMMRVTAWLLAFVLINIEPLYDGAAAREPGRENSGRQADGKPQPKPSVAPGTSIKDYEALVKEWEETHTRNNAEFERIKSDDAKRKEFLRTKGEWNVQQEFAGRFLKLARSQPRGPASFLALAWVAATAYASPGAEEAAALLARDHAGDPRLWPICQDMARGLTYPARGILLRAVVEHHHDRDVRGRACLALADYLVAQADFVRLQNAPGLEPWQAKFFPKDRNDSFRTIDSESESREAEALYERVLREFPLVRPSDLKYSGKRTDDVRSFYEGSSEVFQEKGTLADRAGPQLAAMRTLGVGKLAPEIAGDDVHGVTMKLADFRGKAVLLTFSGEWCGPCNAMMPHEREMVEHFKSRPFAMVSVNSSATKELILKAIASKDITWRCWWDPLGESQGPIATRWHVQGWPTVYLLDHRGMIRVKFVGFVGRGEGQPPIDEAVEALVKEAEAANVRK